MYEKFLMYFCFAGIAIVSPVWLFLFLKKADVRPLQAFLGRLRKESPEAEFSRWGGTFENRVPARIRQWLHRGGASDRLRALGSQDEWDLGCFKR